MAPSKESIKALEKLSLEDPIPCCEPTTKPPLATFDRMMKVMVGAGCVQKEYHIHRGLLCFHSAYFKKLLDGPFEEGGSDSHTLSDVSINTFERFYYWLYTGVVTDGTGVSDANLGWADIINLYVFADFHMVQALKNRAVELFFLHMAQVWGVNAQCSSLMYAGTTQTSMLRKLHIDILLDTYAFGDSSWKDPGQEFPNEFLMDLIDACRTKELVPGSTSVLKTKGKTVWIKEMKRDFCAKYHDHRKVDTYSAAKSTGDGGTHSSDKTTCTGCLATGHTQQECPYRQTTCWNCQKQGHMFRNCAESKWSKITCNKCGEMGLTIKRCPESPSDSETFCETFENQPLGVDDAGASELNTWDVGC